MLLVALGGISIALNDEIFFKLKPALINLIFCAVLGFSAFSSKNLLMIYSQRYMGDMEDACRCRKSHAKNHENTFLDDAGIYFLIVYSAFISEQGSLGIYQRRLLVYPFRTTFCLAYFFCKTKD